ncbi:DUF805 domain-containing protein [Phenylobacterium sp.]|uniref:DUF805 domain-containing protein n=1 Tax=Phenylobacterium sp. TaxID=1871053 RepID=UPI003566A3CB
MKRLFSYFSFRGRTNRQRYWVTGFLLSMLVVVAAFVEAGLAPLSVIGVIASLLFVVILLAGLVVLFANGARRLHDRGMTAWWLLLFLVVPMVLSMPGELLRSSQSEDAQMAGAALALLGLPFSLWGLVVMGFLKGTAGPNKYGDDPLQSAVQEVFA